MSLAGRKQTEVVGLLEYANTFKVSGQTRRVHSSFEGLDTVPCLDWLVQLRAPAESIDGFEGDVPAACMAQILNRLRSKGCAVQSPGHQNKLHLTQYCRVKTLLSSSRDDARLRKNERSKTRA